MSNFKKAIHSKAHKERPTPAAKAKFGEVERHKDYKKRADDHKRKRAALHAMQKKAAERNPDEFNRAMVGVQKKNGKVQLKRDHTKSNAEMKTIRKHDSAYLASALASETNNIERLRANNQMLAPDAITEVVHVTPQPSLVVSAAAQAKALAELTAPRNHYKEQQKRAEQRRQEASKARRAAAKGKPVTPDAEASASASANGSASGSGSGAKRGVGLVIEADSDDEEDPELAGLAKEALAKQAAADSAAAAASSGSASASASSSGSSDGGAATRPFKRPRHTVFVESEADLKSFSAAEHFGTAPELAHRTFNRPRLETIAKAEPLPPLDPKVMAQRVNGYREMAERMARKRKIEVIAAKVTQQQNLMGKGAVQKLVTKDQFGNEIADKTVYRWKPQRKR